MEIRTDKRGILMPPLDPLVSKHRSYRVAVRTAKRRSQKTAVPMAVVPWHDDDSVVMPASMAKGYEEEDLLVEYVPRLRRSWLARFLERISRFLP